MIKGMFLWSLFSACVSAWHIKIRLFRVEVNNCFCSSSDRSSSNSLWMFFWGPVSFSGCRWSCIAFVWLLHKHVTWARSFRSALPGLFADTCTWRRIQKVSKHMQCKVSLSRHSLSQTTISFSSEASAIHKHFLYLSRDILYTYKYICAFFSNE